MSTLTIAPLPIPEGLWDEVRAAWSSPPRAYHSLTHLEEVLDRFAEVAAGPGWQHPREAWLGLLFHDAIYDVRRHDNEAQSAQLARAAIARWFPGAGLDADRVVQLIELTAQHGKVVSDAVDSDARLFLDCDLAILGSSADRFDAYERGIATEYLAVVPPDHFRAGRRTFLETLAARPRLFLSDFFHDRLDAAARANLKRALDAV